MVRQLNLFHSEQCMNCRSLWQGRRMVRGPPPSGCTIGWKTKVLSFSQWGFTDCRFRFDSTTCFGIKTYIQRCQKVIRYMFCFLLTNCENTETFFFVASNSPRAEHWNCKFRKCRHNCIYPIPTTDTYCGLVPQEWQILLWATSKNLVCNLCQARVSRNSHDRSNWKKDVQCSVI